MKDLVRIEATWIKFDSALAGELSVTTALGKARIIEQQVISDQAYFLSCWGQLELEIDGRCRDAVRQRRNHSDWRVRRAWDLYNPNESRFSGLSFEDRAMLVLGARIGRASPFALTTKHYGIRNQIAHGRLRATRIDVSAFVQDCFIIRSALHRAT